MNEHNVKCLFPTCLLLILPNIQVLSQNQSLYRFIINKKEQQAKFALLTLVNEELPAGEYEAEFNISSLHNLQVGIKQYLSIEIYLHPLIFYFL